MHLVRVGDLASSWSWPAAASRRRRASLRRRRAATASAVSTDSAASAGRWHRHSSMQSAVKETKQIVCKQRDSSSQPSDLESDALLLRHAASEQWRLARRLHKWPLRFQAPIAASGIGRRAVSRGGGIGLCCRPVASRRVDTVTPHASRRWHHAGGVGHWRRPHRLVALVGRWHRASAVGTAKPFRGLARI